MIFDCGLEKKSPYIGWEHFEHAVNHPGSRVGHLLDFIGLQISQLISQKSQIDHCLGRLCLAQFVYQLVEVASDLPDQVLGALNKDVDTFLECFSLTEKLIRPITVVLVMCTKQIGLTPVSSCCPSSDRGAFSAGSH